MERNADTPGRPEANIRRATEADLSALSDLCLRSKAVWGYDAAFMAACRDELTLRSEALSRTSIALAERSGRIAAMVQVEVIGDTADLLKLFVAPDALGAGLGRVLFDWATAEAHRLGARRMGIESDPGAVPFYERMGAAVIGTAPSGSIAGRWIPLLSIDLDRA